MTSPSCSSTWFLIGRGNFGDLRIFKADIRLLIFAWIYRTSWPKIGVLEDKIGKGWCDVDPKRTRFYFWGFLRLCQFWWISIKKCAQTDAQIHWHTDRLTNANRFYNLFHATCYSCETDNKSSCSANTVCSPKSFCEGYTSTSGVSCPSWA